ncbi:MAG TPA: hypothetical protein VHO50_09845 [Bacteroidales bacterium]|nr:hypothetical protein [Bacteroidales bacterium]
MKKLLLLLIPVIGIVLISSSCATSRKNNSSLESLMIQENTKLQINRAYYSHHNLKTKKDAYKKYRKNRRM